MRRKSQISRGQIGSQPAKSCVSRVWRVLAIELALSVLVAEAGLNADTWQGQNPPPQGNTLYDVNAA